MTRIGYGQRKRMPGIPVFYGVLGSYALRGRDTQEQIHGRSWSWGGFTIYIYIYTHTYRHIQIYVYIYIYIYIQSRVQNKQILMHALSGNIKNYELAFRSIVFKDMDPKKDTIAFSFLGALSIVLFQYIRDNGKLQNERSIVYYLTAKAYHMKYVTSTLGVCITIRFREKLIEVSHWLSNTCYLHCLE